MILVTLGTINFPFHRAIIWLRSLVENNIINEPVLLQHGMTPVDSLNHRLITNSVSLSRHEMYESTKQASLVISHAGQGSTRMLAEMNTRFILIPRLKRYGEHIDDHQLLFARQVEQFGIKYCTEFNQLAKSIEQRPSPYYGELYKAPLLVEYLMNHYQPEKSFKYNQANR